MGQVDRIPPVSQPKLQTISSDGIQMRKEGHSNAREEGKHDTLELHNSEEAVEQGEPSVEVEAFPEHGLDLSA